MLNISVLTKSAAAIVGAVAVLGLSACGAGGDSSQFDSVKDAKSMYAVPDLAQKIVQDNLQPQMERSSSARSVTVLYMQFACDAEMEFGVGDMKLDILVSTANRAAYRVLQDKFDGDNVYLGEVQRLHDGTDTRLRTVSSGLPWCAILRQNT